MPTRSGPPRTAGSRWSRRIPCCSPNVGLERPRRCAAHRGPRRPMVADDLERSRVNIRVHRAPADRAYRTVVRLAASATLVVMGLIGAFLFARALPALRSGGWRFLTEQAWTPDSGRFGISAV